MPDLLEEHFEELAFLWSQRLAALRSPRHGAPDLRRLDERLDAHLQGLLVQKQAGNSLAGPHLLEQDPAVSFAAASVLLRSADATAISHVGDALLSASGPGLHGIVQALCHAPQGPALACAHQAAASPVAGVAIAGLHVTAFHASGAVKPGQLDRYLIHPDAPVRAAAWRVAALAPDAAPRQTGIFQTALKDPEIAVRHAALQAAAWSRQAWLPAYLRALGAWDDAEVRELFAILAGPDDLPSILRIAQTPALGPGRLAVIGTFGHPGGIDLLLREMANKNPAVAAAAGAAFVKITAIECASGKRARLAPPSGEQPDDFEREFLEEVMLPDVGVARSHWEQIKDTFSAGTRWYRGINVTSALPEADWATLDMESRWQLRLRDRFNQTWSGRLADLEATPVCGA